MQCCCLIYYDIRELTKKLSCFRYHVELVKLLACCTMGKNVNTEIKCHSLLPLDDIVAMVSHQDCIPEVNFLSESLISLFTLYF